MRKSEKDRRREGREEEKGKGGREERRKRERREEERGKEGREKEGRKREGRKEEREVRGIGTSCSASLSLEPSLEASVRECSQRYAV